MKPLHQHGRTTGVFLTCMLSIVLAAAQGAMAAACQPMDFQWVRQSTGTDNECATSDSSGNVYVGGVITGPTANFGNITLSKVGFYDSFVAKYDSAGQLVWAFQTGGNEVVDARVVSIAVDREGNVLACGYFMGLLRLGLIELNSQGRDGFILKLNRAGEVDWVQQVTGPDETYAMHSEVLPVFRTSGGWI